MHHNQTSSRSVSFKTLLLTAVVALIFSGSAVAQRHSYAGQTYGGGGGGWGGSSSDWSLSLSGGYDVPTGDLSTIYKSAPVFSIGVNRNYGDFTFSTTIGYLSYKPKVDTFYYNGTDNTEGYIKYDNFNSLQIYASVVYNVHIGDGAKLYFGANLGAYYNHLSYDSNDGEGGEFASDGYNEVSYLAPKLGVSFMVSDNISLGVEGKYNFQISSDSGSGDTYDYGYSTTVNKSYSGNVVLTYNF